MWHRLNDPSELRSIAKIRVEYLSVTQTVKNGTTSDQLIGAWKLLALRWKWAVWTLEKAHSENGKLKQVRQPNCSELARGKLCRPLFI